MSGKARAASAMLWVLLALGCAGVEPTPVLRVGTSGDYAPFSLDGDGFDVVIARRLAADLGMELRFVPFTWPGLSDAVAANRFDVAMSGVTWRPGRAVLGRMTRALVAGGPCWLGAQTPRSVAVNRGGVLEPWARAHFPKSRVAAVDDNRALPSLLVAGRVEAIVTDRFELPHFRGELERAGVSFGQSCAPARDRKVYWVAPARAEELAPRIDHWLLEHEAELSELRERWLGDAAQALTPAGHLTDLIARRLELMPLVAAWKRARGRPVEDLAREARVLAGTLERAGVAGLDPASVRQLFALQIELAKHVQRHGPRVPEGADLAALRTALSALGADIVDTLARQAPLDADELAATPVRAWTDLIDERQDRRLREALLAVRQSAP